MKICFLGTYDPEYPRNKILIDGLRQNGVEVVECNIKGGGYFIYFPLIKKFLATKRDYDYVFCAFPVHLSVFLALVSRKPVITDALISLYDTAVRDRQLYSWWHPFAMALYLLDILTVKIPRYIIVDTEQHRSYFAKWRSKNSIIVVPVGVHTEEFFPIFLNQKNHGAFLVQFHGSYIPLQGIEKIVEAANLLKNDSSIEFRLIGDGQEFKKIHNLVQQYELSNISFLPWLSIKELNKRINEADVILGIFGQSDKSNRVVPNKIFQGMASKKPVITKDTLAVREFFNESEIALVAGSPKSIASAIKKLQDDSLYRKNISLRGYLKVINQFSQNIIASHLHSALTKLL